MVAIANLVEPLIKVERADYAPLERDIRCLVHAGDLSHAVFLFVAIAVFSHRYVHAKTAAFLEAGFGTLGVTDAQIDQEVELHIGPIT